MCEKAKSLKNDDAKLKGLREGLLCQPVVEYDFVQFDRGGRNMPLYSMKEIWTPLKWVGIKFFKTLDEGDYFVKVGNNPRKKIG